jgi:hypothetical protein
MDLTGEQLLPLPREKVYDALLDPAMLKAAIPGCESVAALGENAYSVAVVTAIGPVKARFKGKLKLENAQRPQGYRMSFEGDGGVAGFARGTAEVKLEPEGDDRTRLRYLANAQIGGKLAAIGARLIDASAAKLSKEFFGRLTELLSGTGGVNEEAASEATSTAAPAAVAAPAPTTQFAAAAPAAPRGVVTIQMPAWTWAVTVVVIAALAAWLGGH